MLQASFAVLILFYGYTCRRPSRTLPEPPSTVVFHSADTSITLCTPGLGKRCPALYSGPFSSRHRELWLHHFRLYAQPIDRSIPIATSSAYGHRALRPMFTRRSWYRTQWMGKLSAFKIMTCSPLFMIDGWRSCRDCVSGCRVCSYDRSTYFTRLSQPPPLPKTTISLLVPNHEEFCGWTGIRMGYFPRASSFFSLVIRDQA